MDYSLDKKLNEIHIGSEYIHEEDEQIETCVQSHVTVFNNEEILRLMEKEIQKFSDIYSISETEATLLLPQFKRSVSDFHKKWYFNAKSVRESVGLLEEPFHQQPSDDIEFYCGVCSESHLLENSTSVSCGHRVCICCWTNTISNSIGYTNNLINESNPDTEWSLWLKCPYVSCQASVGPDMIERFASEEDKSSYNQLLLKSYVKSIKTMKWCPAPGCDYVIDRSSDYGNSDVSCLCLHRFCWNCREDAHSPVDCKSAANWLAMNESDNQSPNWVLANTVPCPNCQRRIEQNHDCSLKMKCLPPCNHQFCWLCRGGEETECDLYTCNFDVVSDEENYQEREKAEFAANRYKDCYTNWMSNELLMQEAKVYLKKLDIIIQNLSNTQLATEPQLKFIQEAQHQIIECRRVLKWSYAYEYYLREEEVEKQALLKHKRVDAENLLKKLYYYVENKLKPFLEAKGPLEKFTKFSIKLTRLTSITRNHYEGLVRELENGLTNFASASTSQ